MTNSLAHPQAVRILLANAKGGCGKTTVCTNLAAYYASQGVCVSLMDYDPQGSSSQWLKARQAKLATIHGVDAFRQHERLTRSWQLHALPQNTEFILIDSPAGLSSSQLEDLLRMADIVLIPITPSAIDIRATTHFIRQVMLSSALKTGQIRAAALANRVKRNTLIYTKLELFLKTLRIPFVTSLRDAQSFIKAAESGCGVMELHELHEEDQKSWIQLIQWLDQQAERVLLQRKQGHEPKTSKIAG